MPVINGHGPLLTCPSPHFSVIESCHRRLHPQHPTTPMIRRLLQFSCIIGWATIWVVRSLYISSCPKRIYFPTSRIHGKIPLTKKPQSSSQPYALPRCCLFTTMPSRWTKRYGVRSVFQSITNDVLNVRSSGSGRVWLAISLPVHYLIKMPKAPMGLAKNCIFLQSLLYRLHDPVRHLHFPAWDV